MESGSDKTNQRFAQFYQPTVICLYAHVAQISHSSATTLQNSETQP